jgi:hypothetical protein
MALGAAVLTHHSADKPLRSPVTILQDRDGPHSPVLLSPAVVSRLRHLDQAADVDDGLALGEQLLGRFELADGLLR